MFEDYLNDSNSFIQKANSYKEENNELEAKRYYRASIFCAMSSMESYINYIGFTHDHAQVLSINEISFLNDKIIEVKPSSGTTFEKRKYHTIDAKIKFLSNRFNPNNQLTSLPYWSHLLEFKELRDGLIHPRKLDDDTDLNEYKIASEKGLIAVINIMNSLSNSVFNKDLRQSILDFKII